MPQLPQVVTNGRFRHVIATLLIAVLLVSGFGPSARAQDDAPFWGYLFADDATASTYTPNIDYQHTSTGQDMTIIRNRIGEYIVVLPVTATFGNVQVSAYGELSTTCTGGAWSINATSELWVNCWDITGVRTDSQFTFFVSSGLNVAPSASLISDDLTRDLNTPITPGDRFQFNATGGSNTITRTDYGKYTIILPGLGGDAYGNVQITPERLDPDIALKEACTILNWSPADNPADLMVTVNCFDASGNIQEGVFWLTYFTGSASTEGTTGTYYRSENGGRTQFSTSGDQQTMIKPGVGNYQILMPRVGTTGDSGTALVTPINVNEARWCSTVVGSLDSVVFVLVLCTDVAGKPVDTDFSLMWVRV